MQHQRFYRTIRLRRFFTGFVLTAVGYLVLTLFVGSVKAAVTANGQSGACGQYYIWYQISPENFPPSTNYIDLYGITFDISDAIDDFDFVYFTTTATFPWAALDSNQDGISDLYFLGRRQNQLEWKPAGGSARINVQECQEGRFHDRCGYAVISIQPKPGFRTGSARIPIGVSAQCSPQGYDCSSTYTILHKYSNCFTPPLPDFIVHHQVNSILIKYSGEKFQYTITVQNTGDKKKSTELTITYPTGTKGGALVLTHIAMTCPSEATCTLLNADTSHINISLTDIPAHGSVSVSYHMLPERNKIPQEKTSYFTNTATLLNGSSARVTVGVEGIGKDLSGEPERRPERPRSRDR